MLEKVQIKVTSINCNDLLLYIWSSQIVTLFKSIVCICHFNFIIFKCMLSSNAKEKYVVVIEARNFLDVDDNDNINQQNKMLNKTFMSHS